MAMYGEFPCGDSMVPLDTSGDYLLAQRIAKMRYDVFKLTTEDILSEARSKARSDDAYKSALRRANRVKAALGVRIHVASIPVDDLRDVYAAMLASRPAPARSGYVPVHGPNGTSFMRADVSYSHKAINVPSLDHSGR